MLERKGDKAKQMSDRAFAELSDMLKQGKSEGLTAYLNAMAKFRSYSLNNIMLLHSQRPDATDVAGFKAWKKRGCHVRQREKGIVIIAPIVCKRERRGDPNPARVFEQREGDITRDIAGFRAAYVFDVSQTEGKSLPSLGVVQGEPGEYAERLKAFVRSSGITLEYNANMSADGQSEGGTIRLRRDLQPAKEFSVLVHELAHEKMHKQGSRASKTVRETEAEAVAFIVSRAIGLDCGIASADYIQLYQGDVTTLTQSLDVIRQAASDIIEAVQFEEARSAIMQERAA